MAIAFSLIYTFCCLTKMSPDFTWLLIGRIFGGVATSMLFSTFESW
jgi:predicted MFS family arabinose efflux permease